MSFNGVSAVAPPQMPGASTNIGTTIPVSRPSYESTAKSSSGILSGLANLAGSVAGSGAIGSAIGVVGNLIGDAIQYKRQKDMYNTQREHALEDYATQRKDYLSDLANERAYNSPLAQVQRLKQAGINPNVAFGSGSPSNTVSTATNQSQMRGSDVPQVAGSPLGESALRGAAGLIHSSLAGVQSQNILQDIALKKAEAIKVLSDSRLNYSKDVRQKIENSFLDSMFTADLAEKQARTNQLIDSLETAALARLSSTYDLYHLKPTQKAQVEAAIAQYYASIRSINQQTAYFDSVKNIRQRNEIMDMKIKSVDMAEAHFKRDIIKAIDLKNANNIAEKMRNDFLEGSFMLKYLWSFK